MSSESAETRFRRLYEEHYETLLAYAARRWPDLNDAHDVVADTFLVLWRRFGDAPVNDEEVLPWLYGISRRVLANRYRGRLRRERLAARFAQLRSEPAETDELAAVHVRAQLVLGALLELREHEREILLLAAWERLSTSEIAAVLGCSENAAALRLHRARRRLTEVVATENAPSGHKPGEWPRLRRSPRKRQGG